MALEDESRFQEFVIDRILPIHVALRNVDGQERNYNGKCFCPFHDNTDTPAAHLYKDEKGSHLMCFSERRVYKPHHVFTEKLVKVSLAKAFQRIWNQLSDESKESLEQSYGQPSRTLPKSWYSHEKELERFKKGEVGLIEHLFTVGKVLLLKE